MKIGILTYHRAENYGALLQAYALRTFLRQQGYEAEFVDYWPEYHVEHYRVFSKKIFRQRNIKGKLMYLKRYLQWGVWRYKRKKRLNRFTREYLGVPQTITYQADNDVCDKFDVVVYGSDQIWRKQNFPGCPGFNYWYFGSDNIKAAKKIAYAASMGKLDVSKEEMEGLKPYLEKFSHITVRESNLKTLLEDYGIKTELVLDPVFLIGRDVWSKIAAQPQKKGKYLLFYNLLNTKESIDFAEQLSKDLRLPIVEINMIIDYAHLGSRFVRSASIPQFLSLIENADCVVSNSFHGVAFSLIFEKQFFALGIGNNAERVVSLLEQIGLSERYVSGKKPAGLIDYNVVRPKLEAVIERSKSIIKSMIKS